MKIRVNCYAGFRSEESPKRYWINGRQVEITEVIKQWQTPEARFFRVRGQDARDCTLKYDGKDWFLESY